MADHKKTDDEPGEILWALVQFMHYFSYAIAPLIVIFSYALMPEMRHKISYPIFIGWGSAGLYMDILILTLLGMVWNITDGIVIVYRHTPSDMISENLIVSIIITVVLAVISGIAFERGALGWWLAAPTMLSMANLLMFAFVGYNVALLKRMLNEERGGH